MTSVQKVLDVLEDSGFERLPRPLTIVGTEFNFEAAARGTGSSHDLVLVSTGQFHSKRLQRLVAGLARSLDLAESRRPVSLVIVGGIAASDRVELERYARVLPIESADPDSAEIENAIAVLLPLKLPNADLIHGTDPINDVAHELGLMTVTSDHFTLIHAAAGGSDAVREALRLYANQGAGWSEEPRDDDD